MGLFGGSETVVGTQVSPVFARAQIPNSIQSGSARAIIQSLDVPNAIVGDLLQGLGLKAERYYDNAARGRYAYGLPAAQSLSYKVGRDEVQAILNGIEGTAVALDYVRLGPPNLLHFAWIRLTANYGWDWQTNQLNALTPQYVVPVYLDDMIINVHSASDYRPGALDQLGIPPNAGMTPERMDAKAGFASLRAATPVREGAPAGTEYITLVHARTNPGAYQGWDGSNAPSTIVKGTIDFSVSDMADPTATYFCAKYFVGSQPKWWTYKVGSGTYPELDAKANNAPSEQAGTFFPMAYFRYDKKPESDNPNPDNYKSSKNQVNILGLNFDSMADKINENPDIENVMQAMMVFGISPDASSPVEQKYLFDFFNQIYESQPTAAGAVWGGDKILLRNMAYTGAVGTWNNINYDISDARFRMRFKARGVYRRTLAGTIGAIGAVTHAKTTSSYSYQVGTFDGDVDTKIIPVPVHTFCRQITYGLYQEIAIYGLEMVYEISGSNYTTSNTTDNILIIPLDHSITKNYSIVDREQLYARSLQFVFNSMEEIHTAWYETGIFQVFLVVVAVIIAYVTGGAGGSLVSAVMATGVSSVVAAIIISSIISLAASTLIQEALTVVASAMGSDLAQLLAVVLVVVAVSTAIVEGVKNAPWAKTMLQAANGLNSAAAQQRYTDLQTDWTNFGSFQEEQQAKLDDIANLLGNDSLKLNPLIVLGESPDDYYSRTIHSGNVGVLSIDAVSHYADLALQLPKANVVV